MADGSERRAADAAADRRASGRSARDALIPDQVQVEPEFEVVGLELADCDVQSLMRAECERLQIHAIDLLTASWAAAVDR